MIRIIRKIRREYRRLCRDPEYDPEWLEHLEWMMLGVLIMEIILVFFVY